MTAKNIEYTTHVKCRTTEERIEDLKTSGCSEDTVRCYQKVSNLIDNCIRVAAAADHQQVANC